MDAFSVTKQIHLVAERDPSIIISPKTVFWSRNSLTAEEVWELSESLGGRGREIGAGLHVSAPTDTPEFLVMSRELVDTWASSAEYYATSTSRFPRHGIRLLGIPYGSPEYIQGFLEKLTVLIIQSILDIEVLDS